MPHMAETMELPRISIKTDVKKAEARPFVGRVVSDSIQPGKYDVDKKPYQWSLAVQPIKSVDGTQGFQIGGKTGAFWEYVSISTEDLAGDIKEQSKFGRHFNAFKNVFGSDEDRSIGRGEYVDQIAWFVRDTIEYGTNRKTGEQIKGTVLLPKRLLTDEEMVQYGLMAGSATPPPTDYTADELEALAAALHNKDRNSFQKSVYQAKLGNKLAQGVAKGNGPAVERCLVVGTARWTAMCFGRWRNG
jgi:hypothetical protein